MYTMDTENWPSVAYLLSLRVLAMRSTVQEGGQSQEAQVGVIRSVATRFFKYL
jgi:hypothetical protein